MNASFGKKLQGKSCYGHLGGTLGGRLFQRLIELGWFIRQEGTATVYDITDLGKQEMEKLGVDIFDRHLAPGITIQPNERKDER